MKNEKLSSGIYRRLLYLKKFINVRSTPQFFIFHFSFFILLSVGCTSEIPGVSSLSPEHGAKNVNPDTRLTITFETAPTLAGSGMIRVFDAATGRAVDSLDLSIPAGPPLDKPDMVRKQLAVYGTIPYDYDATTDATNANTVAGTPSGEAIRDTSRYQLNIIGRFTDGFRFHPVMIDGNTATIYLHNNVLEYGKRYRVTIDEEVFGMPVDGWHFRTKAAAPAPDRRKLTVAANGTGDFDTVQGAMDHIPDFSAEKWEVYIANGDYRELVYFRNKSNVTLLGESRENVVIHYPNNETFNPHPPNLRTNEVPGTFPSRRAAFAADNCYDLHFENLTIKTDLKGQAEGLLIMGGRNSLKNVHIVGSGDALQANGSVYLENCTIDGDGDTILGRGPGFYLNCTLTSNGPFMWIRNTEANHGNVFVNCTFKGKGERSVLARSPGNKGKFYPDAEAVLINCTLDNIPAVGWGEIFHDGGEFHNRFWEYNSTAPDGTPVDVSHRNPLSRQLDGTRDAQIIADYSNPEWVLAGF